MLLLAIKQFIKTLFITPEQATLCKSALEELHASVHARFDAIETPEQMFARIKGE